MTRRFAAIMLGFALALFLAPQISVAVEDHIKEAISHTKMAIDEGKKGDAKQLVVHAEVGLAHAESAEKAKADPHTKQGIDHLKQAIDTGKMGQADVATKHAETALMHLEQAK